MSALQVEVTDPPVDVRSGIARRVLHRPLPSSGLRGWIGPVLVAVVAGLIRFVELGRPNAVIFDENHYVKAALALLRFGYEQDTVEDINERILDSRVPWRELDVFTDSPAFVVHPPVGKWVIAFGEWGFGLTPFGWRFGSAVLGTLSVLMLARIVRRLSRSDVVGTVAGLLLALDGMHIVMSRSALLDISLMFFVVAAFGALLLDRDAVRKRVNGDAEFWNVSAHGSVGPRFGWRGWRIVAGVMLGLACGVKWSGLWFVAAFGLLTLLWDWRLRREIGSPRPLGGVILGDALPAGLSLVGVGLLTYLATWTGWFLSDSAYDRNWAESHPGPWFVPDALRSLMEYHRAAWRFHVHLNSPHSYQSGAWSWLVMSRPTSFAYESENLKCGSDECSAAVLGLGNPVIWWAGILALGHNVWRAIAGRDWRSGALLVAYLAGWVPWLIYHGRTIFTFYAVVMVPFLCGMLALSLAALPGDAESTRQRRRAGLLAAGVFLILVVASAWFFMPIWTGQTLTYDQWRQRMWLPTWI